MENRQFFKFSAILLYVILLLAGCISTQEGKTQPESTILETPTSASADLAQTGFPLAEPGPFYTGTIAVKFIDPNRNNREIPVTIWYPALEQKDSNGQLIKRDAVADMSGAPYPLILTGPNSGDFLFQSHLASHGFVMAIVRFPGFSYEDDWDLYIMDNPLDLLFALDQIASNPPKGLEGVIDSDNAGVAGYSSDGLFSLALSGVRIDPESYLSHCERGAIIEARYGAEWYFNYTCSLAQKWSELLEHTGVDITTSDDGLWQPVSDKRIRAVMPMAPDGHWLYGERGLAYADRPVLMIAMTEDEFSPYQQVSVEIFEQLGAPEKALISFVGNTHMDVMNSVVINRIRHFSTAYFGYHLQGHQDYKEFFSEDFVSQFEYLSWGVYSGD